MHDLLLPLHGDSGQLEFVELLVELVYFLIKCCAEVLEDIEQELAEVRECVYSLLSNSGRIRRLFNVVRRLFVNRLLMLHVDGEELVG